MKCLILAWNKFWFKDVSAYNMLVFRFIILTGGAVFHWFILDSHPATFYESWAPISFYKLLDRPINADILNILRYVWLASTFVAGLGIFYRFFTVVGFLSGVVYLGHDYNFGVVYHSHHLYIMCVGILAFSSLCSTIGIQLSSLKKNKSSEFHWPLRLVQVYVIYVFFLCGVEKLWYGGGFSWAFSESFLLRMLVNPHQTPLARWIIEQPMFVSQIFAAGALFVFELGAPFALLNSKIKILFVFLWSSFHVFVTLTFGNHYAFYSQILCYMAFIDWEKYLSCQKFNIYFLNQNRN
jgi:hypothetical protein